MAGLKNRPKVWVRGEIEDEAVIVLDAKNDKPVYVPKDGVRYVNGTSRFGRPIKTAIVPGRQLSTDGKYVVVWFAAGVEAHITVARLVDTEAAEGSSELASPQPLPVDSPPGAAA